MKNLIVVGQITSISLVLAAEHPHLNGDAQAIIIDGIVRDKDTVDEKGRPFERKAKVEIWYAQNLIDSNASLGKILFENNYVSAGYEVRRKDETSYEENGVIKFHAFNHNGAIVGSDDDGDSVATTNCNFVDMLNLGLNTDLVKYVDETRKEFASKLVTKPRVVSATKINSSTNLEDLKLLLASYEEKAKLPANASLKPQYDKHIELLKTKIKGAEEAAKKANS